MKAVKKLPEREVVFSGEIEQTKNREGGENSEAGKAEDLMEDKWKY